MRRRHLTNIEIAKCPLLPYWGVLFVIHFFISSFLWRELRPSLPKSGPIRVRQFPPSVLRGVF
jgi:hypothetical protein